MRIMAFDYGTKRVGIAVTDPLQLIATALTTIHPNTIMDYLQQYLEKEQVSTFVLGQPLTLQGTASVSAQHVKGFYRSLKRKFPHIPIIYVDERFTSKIASQTIAQSGLKKGKRQNKSLIDSVSAVIILQSYLEGVQYKK